MEEFVNALPSGTRLRGSNFTYVVRKVLGQGTFGITYLAEVEMPGAMNARVMVAGKEFFMHEVNGRTGSTVTNSAGNGMYERYKKKFVGEARNLAKLNNEHIVKVVECFEANDTVYYAMELIDGGSLDKLITEEGSLPERKVLQYTRQIGEALEVMHAARMLHLDLKPGNVMVRDADNVVLIDFGLSKQYTDDGNPESSTSIGGGTPGYAPIEQTNYNDKEDIRHHPVTMDVYALGATMFKMITGERPPRAHDILNDGFPESTLSRHHVSPAISAVIRKAMSPMRRERYQTVADMLAALPAPQEVIPPLPKKPSSRKLNSPIFNLALTAIVFFVLSLLSLYAFSDMFSSKEKIIEELEANMVYVKGGAFVMGEEDTYTGWNGPKHRVEVSDFYISKYEITQEQFEAVMGFNPSKYEGKKKPVETITFEQITDFLNKLNKLTGKNYQLPSEAQWEYAARGGAKMTDTKYSGSDNETEVGWTNQNYDYSGTHIVGMKEPNELGLYDMTGNVDEYCLDFVEKYDSIPQEIQVNPIQRNINPQRPYHIKRGGNFNYYGGEVYERDWTYDDEPSEIVGFRITLIE